MRICTCTAKPLTKDKAIGVLEQQFKQARAHAIACPSDDNWNMAEALAMGHKALVDAEEKSSE
jgi:hypothetical protein